MPRTRRHRSLLEYIAYTAASLAVLWAGHELKLHYFEQRIERVQEQLVKLTPKPVSTPRIPAYQPSEADIRRARAERDTRYEQARIAQAKQDAWARFYEPPPRCIYPEDSKRASVCEANERKQREAFELEWAQQ